MEIPSFKGTLRGTLRGPLGWATRRRVRWATVVAVGFVATLLLIPLVQRAGSPTTVAEVVDGDTLRLTDGQRVRLVQIDTPEVYPEAECWGPQASALAKSLLPPGTAVEVRPALDPYDRYGRLLADVYRSSDGLWVNRELIDRGAARVLVVKPNVANAELFDRRESVARRERRGLWGACGGR